ncbi:hypothetical protein C8F01DRAFT_430473 [Mycena amicta]|nr:hypothetical protein C8F01DRAFT_430473 [Mycena amicta]
MERWTKLQIFQSENNRMSAYYMSVWPRFSCLQPSTRSKLLGLDRLLEVVSRDPGRRPTCFRLRVLSQDIVRIRSQSSLFVSRLESASFVASLWGLVDFHLKSCLVLMADVRRRSLLEYCLAIVCFFSGEWMDSCGIGGRERVKFQKQIAHGRVTYS